MLRKNKINKIIINTLRTSKFTIIRKANQILPEHYLVTDLLVDSIDLAVLVLELEEEFNKDIPDKECCSWSTVQDIYNSFEIK